MGPKPTACYIRLGGFLVSEGDEQLKDGTAYSPLRPTNVVVSEVRAVLSGIPMPTANDW